MKKLSKDKGVKLSQTLSGQRELIREMRNKVNEIIDSNEKYEAGEVKIDRDIVDENLSTAVDLIVLYKRFHKRTGETKLNLFIEWLQEYI